MVRARVKIWVRVIRLALAQVTVRNPGKISRDTRKMKNTVVP